MVQETSPRRKLDDLCEELHGLARQLHDVEQAYRDQLVGLERRIDEVTGERDDALARVEDLERIEGAVYEFFDALDSPAPEIRERALDDLKSATSGRSW